METPRRQLKPPAARRQTSRFKNKSAAPIRSGRSTQRYKNSDLASRVQLKAGYVDREVETGLAGPNAGIVWKRWKSLEAQPFNKNAYK
jgi:hypothetical protein